MLSVHATDAGVISGRVIDAHECSRQRFGSSCHITDAMTQARPKLLVVDTDGLVDRLCCNRLRRRVLGWTLHQSGTRAFRHALDYREPFCQMPDAEMISLLDELLELRREVGSHDMMLRAAQCLSPAQRMTAYAMASEIMRSDGPFQRQERAFLDHLALMLEISGFEAQRIDAVFEIFHARLTLSSRLTTPALEETMGLDVETQPDPTVVH